MKRIALVGIVCTGALLAPAAGFAQVSCSRDGLQRAADLYIAAQTKGDTSGMPLAMGLGYMENVALANINEGLIKKRSTDSLLTSITDVFSKSGVIGRALGFGNIKILTASGDAGDDNFTSMKQPDAFKKTIVEQKMEAARPAPSPAAAPVAAPAPAPAAHPASSKDAMATLTELAKLRDAGAITPEEYESKKVELLARI